MLLIKRNEYLRHLYWLLTCINWISEEAWLIGKISILLSKNAFQFIRDSLSHIKRIFFYNCILEIIQFAIKNTATI
jgi:hypothetical protein